MKMPMPFDDSFFCRKFLKEDSYRSAALPAVPAPGLLRSCGFYYRLFLGPVRWLCAKAARGECTDAAWVHASAWVAELMEGLGCPIFVDGMRHFERLDGPCLFVGNHMSTLETFLLPSIIRPFRPVTFVVKKSLTTMPFFGAVMRSRDPIVVERVNPRQDLAAVLEGGQRLLEKGISVIVFPQSTRTRQFSEEHFNTIGIKLARKAGVPVVPLALKTDAWGKGRHVKELGPVRPGMPVRFVFGEAMCVNGNGKAEHAAVCSFIREHLARWEAEDGVNGAA